MDAKLGLISMTNTSINFVFFGGKGGVLYAT